MFFGVDGDFFDAEAQRCKQDAVAAANMNDR
jgi:hypothetical protein